MELKSERSGQQNRMSGSEALSGRDRMRWSGSLRSGTEQRAGVSGLRAERLFCCVNINVHRCTRVFYAIAEVLDLGPPYWSKVI